MGIGEMRDKLSQERLLNRTVYTSCMRWGKNLLIRGYTLHAGCVKFERVHEKLYYEPTVFVESTSPDARWRYKSLDEKTLTPLTGMDMKRAKEFINGQRAGTVWGMDRFEYQWTAQHPMADVETFRVLTLDIETECEDGFPDVENANEEINLITMSLGKKKVTIGTTKHGTMKSGTDPDHTFFNCKTEDELISRFIHEWKKMDPDIVTGWNANLFDLPYLYNRIEKRRGSKLAKKMSPWEVVQKRTVMINGKQQTSYIFYGINILDYLDLYKKYTYQMQPSYKLDYIASVELGTKKLSYDEHDTIHSFYKKDWNKFVDYNIKDVDIVTDLDKKMHLISLAIMSASDAHANVHDVFSQVRMWDLLIYNHLFDKDIIPVARVVPPDGVMDQYAGAYVKEPVPGMYDWVVTFDVSSMYPNAIRYLNISPETVVDDREGKCASIVYAMDDDPEVNIKTMIEDKTTANKIGKDAKEADICVSPTGDMFDKSVKGFLPEMMKELFDYRKTCKKMSDAAQLSADLCEIEMRKRGIDVDSI